MIKSIEISNEYLAKPFRITMGDSDKSGFLIVGIEGMTPCKATINSTEMATGDGSIFNSARLESRNLVLSVLYDYRGSFDVEELRYLSYKIFPVKKKVKITIHTDRRDGEIEGYVESNEPAIFSPRCGAQISILCPDPYFHTVGEEGTTVTRFGSIRPNFEFPFSSPPSTNNLEFSVVDMTSVGDIEYIGDSEVGMSMTIECLGDVEDIVLSKIGTPQTMTLSSSKITSITGAPLHKLDVVTINTERNNKRITLLRNGIETNILNCLDRNSVWFTLTRGFNRFSYSVSNGGMILFSISNKTLYEGM